MNPLFAIDSYKLGHADQYPEGTEYVYSNFTPRSSKNFKTPLRGENKIVWFGLQGVLRKMNEDWQENFFKKDKQTVCSEFAEMVKPFVGPSGFKIERIEALHDLGYLPIKVKALPEGSRVNIGVPVFTIVNTHSEFYWITNYLETYLSCELWKSTTSATIAYEYKKILNFWADVTGADKNFVQWQAHDFSMRGMSNTEDAAKSGAGHLLSFTGTDCIPAIAYLNKYYFGELTFVGGSVPATEHSVMCMGGEDDEIGTFKRLVTEVYPNGIVSIVSDTWDFWKVITEYALELKQEILNRGTDEFGNSKVVFRPDSGDPVKILTGYRKPTLVLNYTSERCAREDAPYELVDAECVLINGDWYACNWLNDHDWEVNFSKKLSEVEVKGAVECLWDIFGGTVNNAGYKEVSNRVGLIYGDSITLERADEILRRLEAKGYASSNVVLGVGSFTYQYNTRDTFGFAMKATYGVVNGEGREIVKNPKTDDGVKKSKKGLLRVEEEGDNFVVYDEQSPTMELCGVLEMVYQDGMLYEASTLEQIRNRLK